MKLSKEKTDALLAMDDAHLWQEIASTAERFGYTLPKSTPDQKNMSKLRSVIREADKMSAMEVARLLSAFKQKKKKE